MDEAWSFVAKKEKNCDDDEPDDRFAGTAGTTWRSTRSTGWSCRWSRERTAESVEELVGDVKERLGGRVPRLITTDEYSAYEGAILEAFGTEVVPPRTGRRGRPAKVMRPVVGRASRVLPIAEVRLTAVVGFVNVPAAPSR